MNCQRVQQRLSSDLEGLLSPSDTAAVAEHLRGCPACRCLRGRFLANSEEMRTLPEPFPSPTLQHRIVESWSVESGGSPAVARQWAGARHRPLITGVAAAATVLVLALSLRDWSSTGKRLTRMPSPHDLVSSTAPAPENLGKDVSPGASDPWSARAAAAGVPGGPGPTAVRFPELAAAPRKPKVDPRGSWRHDGNRADTASIGGPATQRPGDLETVRGDVPGQRRPWTPLPRNSWEELEDQVRRRVPVRDDFVQIPFPRLVAASDRQLVAAVESYKREAAVVDARLAREVALAVKATALIDLCERLKGETGTDLRAGSSVADEKVTVFCEKQPLRDVMRQLSRPFGYAWLRSGKQGEYRYELVQDLKSQLLEEELRNRDRHAALLALENEIDRYRPYLGLSPDEALARAKTAAPEEKKLLENFAGWGWGPLQLYARLSPQEQASLRAGRRISFSGDPRRVEKDSVQPLPPDLERGVLQSMRDVRVRRPDGQGSSGPTIGRAQDLPDGVLPSASPEADGFVSLRIGHSELGEFTLDGGSGVTVGSTITIRGHDLAKGVSSAVQDPENGVANARLARDPALQRRVTVVPVASCPSPSAHREPASGGPAATPRVTTADVLEALHRATGMPIVADFYTHLYPPAAVSVSSQSLFEALNRLSDAMHLRWKKDAPGTAPSTAGGGGAWLQFRSVSYYDNRVKEVPNRLLSRWASSRQKAGWLPLDELIEMAQLSDTQLDSGFVAEGMQECWGLPEWSLARNREGRPHLRYLAQLTPAQRQTAMSVRGVSFSQLSLAQQQGLIAHLGTRLQSLEEVAGATVRVEYSQPNEFRWPAGGEGFFGLSLVRALTRAAALSAALRLDGQVTEAQIGPTDLSLAVIYTLIDPKTGKTRENGVRARADGGARINW
jgi:hypothetical protein